VKLAVFAASMNSFTVFGPAALSPQHELVQRNHRHRGQLAPIEREFFADSGSI